MKSFENLQQTPTQALDQYFSYVYSTCFETLGAERGMVVGLEGWANSEPKPWGQAHFYNGKLARVRLSYPKDQTGHYDTYEFVTAGQTVSALYRRWSEVGASEGYDYKVNHIKFSSDHVQKIHQIFTPNINKGNYIALDTSTHLYQEENHHDERRNRLSEFLRTIVSRIWLPKEQ